jgi:uncharacterized protein (TIGR00251 family)
MIADLDWQRQADGITIRIHVQPGASRNAVIGLQGTAMKVAVQARPVAGAANEALVRALADWFSLNRRQVCIRHGEQQRQNIWSPSPVIPRPWPPACRPCSPP